MKRVINTLNEMSFELPKGYEVSEDVYSLPNGQGMINKENYADTFGHTISLFEIHRDPDEFFSGYENMLKGFGGFTDKYSFVKSVSLKSNGFIFPFYIIKGRENMAKFAVHAFVNCGDCLACFIVYIDHFDGSLKKAIENEKVLADLTSLLRTIE